MALKIEITACSWLVHGFLTKVGFIVNKRSEMLSLLWSVNLFIQVCKLIFIKLSWKDLIPTKFRSIVQRALLSTKNLHGCSECRLRFQISVSKENTICEKNKEALCHFFQLLNYFLCWFASRLWNILLCGKYTQLSADHRVSWPVPDLVSYPPFPSGSGARFSKVLLINGPGKLSRFSLKIEVSIVLHLTW